MIIASESHLFGGLTITSHLPSSNTFVSALVPVVKDLNLVAMIVAIGLLYTIGFLLTESQGLLSAESHRIKRLALLASLVWVVTVIGGIFTEVANIDGAGFLDAFNASMIRAYLSDTGLGHNQLFQLIAGALALEQRRLEVFILRSLPPCWQFSFHYFQAMKPVLEATDLQLALYCFMSERFLFG